MGKRFVNPPNWPTPPPGWTPPQGWQPDPAWGPAPPGHVFWVDDGVDERHAMPQQGASPPGELTWLPITALALAIVSLLLCWVPIVNNVVVFLGLLALGFSIAAMISSFRRKRAGKAMAITAGILSMLAILGVFVTQAFYGSLFDNSTTRVEPEAQTTTGPSGSTTEQPVTSDGDDLAALGQLQEVGDYNVTVDAVALDANQRILDANQFNEAPDGQYVAIELTVQYLGTEEGNPWLDLSTTFVGSDARQYDASDCDAVTSSSVMDVPTLENSGVASYEVCMDVPVAAIDGGEIFVERSFSSNARAYWAIR